MNADMLPWIVASVSILMLLLSALAFSRSHRHLRAAHEETVAGKNEQISALEAQLVPLRESESVRFVERYLASKNGLQQRQEKLQERLEEARSQQEILRTELADLSLSDGDRETEAQRLRQDLLQANDQVRRLEGVLKEVAAVGPLDVNSIRHVLGERRELALHIKERLDRITLEHQDRISGVRIRETKLEQLEVEIRRLRRELEITRAAGAMVDGIMGIDGETKTLLARHASERIEGALQSLDDLSRRSPISRFVDVLKEQRPERLLRDGEMHADSSGNTAARTDGSSQTRENMAESPRPSELGEAESAGNHATTRL